MFKNYFKIALRNLTRFKIYSFINIAGLAVGMACSILIILFVLDELNYDRFHKNSDRIYRLSREWFNQDGTSSLHLARVAPPIGPLLKNDFPNAIEEMTRIIYDWETLVKVDDKSFIEEGFFWAEENFFKVFSFKLLKGNTSTALSEPYSCVITESTAKKYFGDENPVGKTILYGGEDNFKVTGVVEDIPKNSHFKFDLLGSFITLNDYIGIENLTRNWGSNNYVTYLLLPKNFPVIELEKQIPGFLDKHISQLVIDETGNPPAVQPSKVNKLHLWKLTDIHLHSQLTTELEENGNINDVYIFSITALLILLIAYINFMNLATARSAKRAREIGMRKVLGAYKRQLMLQFIGESLIISFIALFFAIVIVEAALPFFNNFIDKQLSLNYFGNPTIILGLVGLTLLVGLISGSYPAFLLSSFNTIKVLKGNNSSSRKSTFRTVLVVSQFTISIALIICMGIVYSQMEYFRSKDLGYDKSRIVLLPSSDEIKTNIESVKSQLYENPKILNITSSRLVPSNMLLNSWGGQIVSDDKAEPLTFRLAVDEVDHDFIKTYNLQIIAGRDFSREFGTDDTSAFILNEAAVKQLSWNPLEAIGKRMNYGNRSGEIIGVVNNFHFESLHNKIVPVIFLLSKTGNNQFSVKISGNDITRTIEFLKKKWSQFRPDYPFEYKFLEDQLDELYTSEKTLGDIFGIFSMLAVIIACLGLFGLASFAAEQRTKEIGIRKVLGATVSGIVVLFSIEFLKLVIISNLIAWSLAYYAMNSWLEDFAYKTDMSIWIFILSGLVAILIALLTVSFQAMKTGFSNPVKSLRYE
jgi:putative ABC transport system permease protein